MTASTLHFLDARGRLRTNRAWLARIVKDADSRIRAICDPGPVDIVIRPGTEVVPELGHLGHSPSAGQIFITVDPANPEITRNPNGVFQRSLAHGMHHSMRWDGPGYGRTLGEALVSEGLAGQFAKQAFGPPAAPWEKAYDDDEIDPPMSEALSAWDDPGYDHAEWFYGAGGRARWAGHTLGFRLVGAVLEREGITPAAAANWPAEAFRPKAA
ncbi:DUF2268 domain-containing putative Zn-dependent protease [Palleronia sediminis]|nr:DUF2268 domain-containing putative Zn-dependent protease [Palleronia sediminis]